MPPRPPRLLTITAAHLLVLFAILPKSPWEFDEPLFFQALHHYNPVQHHPPPPGYPLFILFGTLIRIFAPSDFAALVAVSVASSIIGFVLLALALRNLTGDGLTGIVGALFFYGSPALLVHSTLPISEPGALALLFAALYFGSRKEPSPALFAAFAALTVGWRLQFSIFVVPLLFAGLFLFRRWRDRGIVLAVFTLVCLAWLLPLAIAVGGPDDLVAFQLKQGRYVATQDADQSRTGWSPARIAFRFIGRAWGSEWTALPLLAAAAAGFVQVVRRRLWRFAPLLAAAAVYITFALLVMDPADGVRYSIPFLVASACLAAVGARWLGQKLRFPGYALPLVALFAFLVYTAPLLVQRSQTVSPPVRAAEYALRTMPQDAVVLYELPLWPHTMYYLADRQPHRVDDGLAKFWDSPEVPLFIYADGETARDDARVFSWRPNDAYRKMTRNHYRVSSIIPMPPERRFRKVAGVHGSERSQEAGEWRWLDSPAEIQLPRGPARMLVLRVGLSAQAPLETNRVSVFVNGAPAGGTDVVRGSSSSLSVAVPAGSPVVRIESERSFVPAEIPEMRSGDRRRLAVELYDLVTRPDVAAEQ